MPLWAELLRLGCPSGQTTPPTRSHPAPANHPPCGHRRCRACSQPRDLRPGPTPDPLIPPTPEHAARRPRLSLGARVCRPAPEHVAGRARMLSGAAPVARGLCMSLGACACCPATAHVSGRLRISLGNAYVVRHLRMSSGSYGRMSLGVRVRRPAPARVVRRLRISLGAYAFPSEPADDPPAPREQKHRRGVSSGRAISGRRARRQLPRPTPGGQRTGPRNRRRWSRGPVKGGAGCPARAVTRAAAPPPPCPGWSPRRRESAGTRRCAGGATHGRPRA